MVPKGGQRRQYIRPRFVFPDHLGREYETAQALGCGGTFLSSRFRQDTALLRSMGVRFYKRRYHPLSAFQLYTHP